MKMIVKVINKRNGNVVCEECTILKGVLDRMKGLIGRKFLSQGEGVLITECKSIHTMFMGFPIDVAFLDSVGTVMKVKAGISPWRMTGFVFKASMVLELSKGVLKQTETQAGDQLSGFENV